ncbi:VOC family protein [Mucilaginibacter pedocola]|uniref:VOC domain-containing protein n=1 Tax=Mucilaginibacter pedocola TaxID=1792845 RepID=A0A1S9PA13_9SPHI|nr:hypothetical protein [Mucilaginibacter pedocola]OOQ57814.1 hypothetical protein BC343_13610 [Mucilaginibacter pedocola]
MKKTNSLYRVSFRSETAKCSPMERFATNILNAKNIMEEPGLKLCQLEDGTLLEFYGTGSFPPENMFKNGDTVISFRVQDLQQSVTRLLEEGARLVADIKFPCSGLAFCHVQLKDDHVIGIFEEK